MHCPYKKADFLRKIWEIQQHFRILGLGGSGGVIFIVRKLRIIILLHFRLGTFRIQYWKTRKVIIVTGSGPGGCDHDSPNQYYLSLETPGRAK